MVLLKTFSLLAAIRVQTGTVIIMKTMVKHIIMRLEIMPLLCSIRHLTINILI
jgi:hypothetical protein